MKNNEPSAEELLACSSIKLTSKEGNPYWFRTLDFKTNIWDNGAHLVSFPKGQGITLTGDENALLPAYDIMGMTYNQKDEWLLDGINSAGLLGGLLFLYEGTSAPAPDASYTGVVGLEVLTFLLSGCATAEDVCAKAKTMQVLNIPIRGKSIPSTLHYIFMDASGKTVVLEAADPAHPGVFQITADQQTGIMTNSPVYSHQLENLAWFISQSPELNYGDGTTPRLSLDIDGTVIRADAHTFHVCRTGTFPASYTSYDRFVRLSILKALNHNGRDFSDAQMLPRGMGILRSVFEPHNQGIYHYVHMDAGGALQGQGDGYTQYVIVYDLARKTLYLQPYDTLVWTKLSMSDCSQTKRQCHAIRREEL